MLFTAIGEEWARAQQTGPGERHAAAERLVRGAPPNSIPEQWAKYVQEHSMELFGCWQDLLDLARARMLDGEDVAQVGQLLVAIGHLTHEGQAAGRFLVGHTHRFLDEGARHLGLARSAYLDVGRPALAAIAGVTAEAARLVGAERMTEEDVNLDALGQAVDVLVAADSACAERLRPALGRFASILHLTHDLMAGGQLPTEPFPVTEDEVDLLRMTMVAALTRPERAVDIARWTQSARGLPADSTAEFDVMVELLSSVHDWEPRLVLLRDMIDHGDRRDETVIHLARTLIELGRSNEAKAALEARIGARPGPEHIELLRFLVMLGQTERDPDTPRWTDALLAAGGDLESMMPPLTQAAETDGGARQQLMAHFDPVEGRLTLDPRIPPGEIAAHMNAALILGQGPEEGAEILRTLACDRPELHRQVLDLLPVEARLAPTAAERMRAGEELFGQRRFDEAIGEYEAALDIEPDLEYAELCIGDCHFAQGKYHLAMAHFTESIAIRPTPQAWRFLGDCHLKGHDLHQAKRCYEEALRLDPSYGAARSILRQVAEQLAEVGGR
jgi:tetratricopeptide (TPR) repeat protein